MCSNSDSMYTYAYVVLGSPSIFTTFAKRKLMSKSREICVGLRIGARAMMKEKYDDAMICTNIYKYICIYTTMYKYEQQSLVFSQENFFVGVTMFLLLLICCLIGNCIFGFFSQKWLDLAIFGVLGQI